jgi:hypothetical protein
MSKSLRFLISSLTMLLVGCHADVLTPSREPSASLAARAGAAAFTTTSNSDERVNLTWPDNASNEAGWEVHRSTTGAAGSFALLASLVANTNGYDDTGLAARTQYCYKVRSFKKQGAKTTYAAFTNVSCTTTLGPPAAPTGFSAVPRNSRTVDVVWTDNANDEQGFRIERAATPAGPWGTVATVAANVVSSSDQNEGLTEQQLCYRIVAFGMYGQGASNVDCTVPPRGPSTVSASSNAQSIDVTWLDASANEDGYEVQRAKTTAAWQIVANLPANATSFHDAAIVAGEEYQYRVGAKRDGGFSDFGTSNAVAAATRLPEAPALQAALPAGSTRADVSWSNRSTVARELRVERSTDGQLTWLTVASVQPGQSQLYDADRTPDQEVCYRVIASNALGSSPSSNVDCTIPPARPTNLTVTRSEDGGTLITWTDNSNFEHGYEFWTTPCPNPAVGCLNPRQWTFPPNATGTFIYLDPDEYFDGLYAIYEGKYSDPATWAESAAPAVPSATSRGGMLRRVAPRVAPPTLQTLPGGVKPKRKSP